MLLPSEIFLQSLLALVSFPQLIYLNLTFLLSSKSLSQNEQLSFSFRIC